MFPVAYIAYEIALIEQKNLTLVSLRHTQLNKGWIQEERVD